MWVLQDVPEPVVGCKWPQRHIEAYPDRLIATRCVPDAFRTPPRADDASGPAQHRGSSGGRTGDTLAPCKPL